MLTKLLKGSNQRKSRLHDCKGQIVPTDRLLKNGPRAVATGLMRLALGVRPETPWISYEATKLLDSFLDKGKTVLEFGSGMSTVWYASRAGKVVSIENYRPWYDQVSALFAKRGLTNVDYRFAGNDSEYAIAPEGHDGFDLIMVDGSIRDLCTRASIELLKPGGIYYLDNSDRTAFPDSGEFRAAEIALDFAKKHRCSVTYFTDFAPTQFFAQEGMMIRRPQSATLCRSDAEVPPFPSNVA